jgi:hypothetical protein
VRAALRSLAWAVKALTPAAALGLTLAVVFGGISAADAASSVFVLGKSNSEASKATLSNSRGVPLSLSAPKNTAPLSVSGQTMVENLNAQFVGGLNASAAEATGGVGFTRIGIDIPIDSDTFTKVTSTGTLPAGSYYVTATATVLITPGDTGAQCQITKPGGLSDFADSIVSSSSGFLQAVENTAIQLKSPSKLQEVCIGDGNNEGTEVTYAGITAVRVQASHGKAPQVNGIGLNISRSRS